MAEVVSNQVRIVDAGAVAPLVDVLRCDEAEVVREAARAIGNLSANVDFAAMFFKLGIVPLMINMLRSSDITAARMAAMALSNVATNVKNQPRMVRKGVVEPIVTLARAGLDPKSGGDREAERYALLVLANLSVTKENHKAIMDAGLDLLVGMSKSPDLRCRQHAIFALGNLASQPANGDMIVEGGCVKPIISFAFPGDLNVQFQAVAALRGLSMQSHIRLQIVRAGALEPLILAAGSDSVEVQREVAATLANLTMVRALMD